MTSLNYFFILNIIVFKHTKDSFNLKKRQLGNLFQLRKRFLDPIAMQICFIRKKIEFESFYHCYIQYPF